MPAEQQSTPNNVTAMQLTVKLDGSDTAIKAEDMFDFTVETDLDHPDMATLVLNNEDPRWSTKAKIGAEIELNVGFTGSQALTIFKGEVTGIEPTYDVAGPSRVTLRALNRMHRLSRGKKSRTFKKVKDSDIAQQIAGENSLSADVQSTSTVFEHVYQHNQTDLEFLRLRAARIGFEVTVDDKKLVFKPAVKIDSGVELAFGTTLEKFTPRLSAASQVSEVAVYGWDFVNKQKIMGKVTSGSVELGAKSGSSVAQAAFGKGAFHGVDIPVASQDEATAIAKAILRDRAMSFVTGDGVCQGDPRIRAGIVIQIKLGDDRFDGKYYVTAVRHRYNHGGSTWTGYRTLFKVASDGVGK